MRKDTPTALGKSFPCIPLKRNILRSSSSVTPKTHLQTPPAIISGVISPLKQSGGVNGANRDMRMRTRAFLPEGAHANMAWGPKSAGCEPWAVSERAYTKRFQASVLFGTRACALTAYLAKPAYLNIAKVSRRFYLERGGSASNNAL